MNEIVYQQNRKQYVDRLMCVSNHFFEIDALCFIFCGNKIGDAADVFFSCLFLFCCLNAYLAYDAGDVLDSVSGCKCLLRYVLMEENLEASFPMCCAVFLVLCCVV